MCIYLLLYFFLNKLQFNNFYNGETKARSSFYSYFFNCTPVTLKFRQTVIDSAKSHFKWRRSLCSELTFDGYSYGLINAWVPLQSFAAYFPAVLVILVCYPLLARPVIFMIVFSLTLLMQFGSTYSMVFMSSGYQSSVSDGYRVNLNGSSKITGLAADT